MSEEQRKKIIEHIRLKSATTRATLEATRAVTANMRLPPGPPRSTPPVGSDEATRTREVESEQDDEADDEDASISVATRTRRTVTADGILEESTETASALSAISQPVILNITHDNTDPDNPIYTDPHAYPMQMTKEEMQQMHVDLFDWPI